VTWIAVGVGGALGATARALIDLSSLGAGSGNLWSLLLVNIVGAGTLGVVIGHGTPRLSEPLRAGLTTGFLGSFTTFSAIMTAWLGLTRDDPLVGVAYVAATFIAGSAAAYGGVEAGVWWRHLNTQEPAS